MSNQWTRSLTGTLLDHQKVDKGKDKSDSCDSPKFGHENSVDAFSFFRRVEVAA